MGTSYVEWTAEDIRTLVKTWNQTNATNALFKAFGKALITKKKYAKEFDETDIDLILGNSVRPALLEVIKKVPESVTGLDLYTDTAFFSRESKLKLDFNVPKSGKVETKTLLVDVDWNAVKGLLKQEAKNVDPQLKEALKESAKSKVAEDKLRKKKLPLSWTLFEHKDISPLINAKLSQQQRDALGLGALPISLILADKLVMERLAEAADMPNVQEKVKNAADFGKIVQSIAEVAAQAADIVIDDPTMGKTAEGLIGAAVEEAIIDAGTRALKQVDHFEDIRVDVKKYKVVAAVKVSAGVLGLVAGVVGIALAPFTFGASLVLACAGLWRGAIQLGDQLGKLSLEAEETAGLIADQTISMLDSYEDWKNNAVGAAEVGKELLKVVLPTDLIPTIKGVRGLLGTLNSKTNIIEIDVDELSKTLSQLTDKELEATRAFEQFLRENRDVLTKKEKDKVEKLLRKIPELRQSVEQAITDVMAMNTRVDKCRHYHEVLTAGYMNLQGKNPIWAVVVNELIPLAADIGIAAGGGIGGAVESLGAVAEAGKKAADSIGLILSVGNDLYDIVDDVATELGNRR